VALTGSRTYVGFGFGAIQGGLFLNEAFGSGAFGRLVVADVVPGTIAALKAAGGEYRLNIAHADRLERALVGPVEILDLNVPADREQMVEAVAAAEDIGVAVPSVDYYVSDGPGSLHAVLAEGLRRKIDRDGPRAIVYAAENHNQAAEILRSHVLDYADDVDAKSLNRVAAFVNTVIGKMSGVVAGAADIADCGLAPVTAGEDRAFLVEAFNRILISPPRFDEAADVGPFQRGITAFEEKADLLPFEEAKLYGHNAVHALAAYVGAMLGVEYIADLPAVDGVMPFLRAAFIEESGAALIAKHGGTDPLFTPDGFAAYADDLLERMTNRFLRDSVERVGRHPERKLGWHDRLIGTMNEALAHDIEARRFAFGAAAALVHLDESALTDPPRGRARLEEIWGDMAPSGPERQEVLDRIEGGLKQVRAWRDAGHPRLDEFI